MSIMFNPEIAGYHFTTITPIDKGWSGDKKYYAESPDGRRYLLRISDGPEFDRKKAEYEALQRVFAINVPISEPLAFGTFNQPIPAPTSTNTPASVYTLLGWCDGEDAERLLPLLSETDQYVLGLRSGEILRRIHSIPAPADQEPWVSRFNRKVDMKIAKYRECGLRFDGDDRVIAYLEANRDLLADRPQCFQHGDYHVGNMVIDRMDATFGYELSVIDFNRYDYGDPWEEFNRIVWSAAVSPYFATGQLVGYFGGKPPIEFFKLLAFYIASNTVSSIYWAISFGEDDLNTMIDQARDVLSWYAGMHDGFNPVPSWYIEDFYIQYADGAPYKLKSPFDMSFLSRYGTVFKVYDDQDSGNICFGVKATDHSLPNRLFVKFAGAPTARGGTTPADAISNLMSSVQIYRDLTHPNLIQLVSAEEVSGGYAAVFEWCDGECMGRMYPLSRHRFMDLPISTHMRIFEDIVSFHIFVAKQGYVAIDFYDASILYDINAGRTLICDIDFYAKTPYSNNMGRLWGSSRFMSPEEFLLGADIDEITNVYTMGATAFALFSNYDRSREHWTLSDALYIVAARAVCNDRTARQQSLLAFFNEWQAAKGEN